MTYWNYIEKVVSYRPITLLVKLFATSTNQRFHRLGQFGRIKAVKEAQSLAPLR